MSLDDLYKNDEEYVKRIIDEAIDNRLVGIDYVGLSIVYQNKENTEKIADFLVKHGMSDQYFAMLKLNKDLDIDAEFTRVKKYDKCYCAIANFLTESARKYCEYKVIEKGKPMDIVSFMLNVEGCDKIALSKALIKTKQPNAIAYAVKYADKLTFRLLQGIEYYFNHEQRYMLDIMLDIMQNSNSSFAKQIAKETIEKRNNEKDDLFINTAVLNSVPKETQFLEK